MTQARRKSVPQSDEPFFHFSNAEKEHFLILFIEDMTIEIRDSYLLGPEVMAANLKSGNELLHRLTATLRALHENDDKRFPDEILFNMIRSAARDEGLQRQIETALQNSYRYLKSERAAKPPRKVAPAH